MFARRRHRAPLKYAAVSLRCYVGFFCRSPLQVSFDVFRSVLNVRVEEAMNSSEIRSYICAEEAEIRSGISQVFVTWVSFVGLFCRSLLMYIRSVLTDLHGEGIVLLGHTQWYLSDVTWVSFTGLFCRSLS